MTWDQLVRAAGDVDWVTYVASSGPDGRPHVAPVSPGFTEGTIWFGSRSSSRKVRNLRGNPNITFHWPVTSGSGPGELFARGVATLHDSDAARRRLWDDGVLGYDPVPFFRSPDNPDLVFVETAVSYASLLGPDFRRDIWRPGG